MAMDRWRGPIKTRGPDGESFNVWELHTSDGRSYRVQPHRGLDGRMVVPRWWEARYWSKATGAYRSWSGAFTSAAEARRWIDSRSGHGGSSRRRAPRRTRNHSHPTHPYSHPRATKHRRTR